MAQIMKLDAVARLPEEVQRDADNIVNNDESLENRVESSCPAYKESEGEVEFHGESKHCEGSVGDEVLKEPLFIPSALVGHNTAHCVGIKENLRQIEIFNLKLSSYLKT